MHFISSSECDFSPGKAGLNFHSRIHLSRFSLPPFPPGRSISAKQELRLRGETRDGLSLIGRGGFPFPIPGRFPVPGPSEPHGGMRIPAAARQGARSTPDPAVTLVTLAGKAALPREMLLDQPREMPLEPPRPGRAAPLGPCGATDTDTERGHPATASPDTRECLNSTEILLCPLQQSSGQVPSPCAPSPIATRQRLRLGAASLLCRVCVGLSAGSRGSPLVG